MRRTRRRRLGLIALEERRLLAQIAEFMASSAGSILDEDGDREGWIELHNPEPQAVDLTNWFLTDDALDLAKWQLPAVTLESNERLLVFASGKDRRDPAATLHTNFRLNDGGEYLALVESDQFTVADSFAPEYPVQTSEFSYGTIDGTQLTTLLASNDRVSFHVPTDESLMSSWTDVSFDDVGWLSGIGPVGYDRLADFDDIFNTDLEPHLYTTNPGVFLRSEFDVTDTAQLQSLTLRTQYDDGFIAYLNGAEVARRNSAAVEPIAHWDFEDPQQPGWDRSGNGFHATLAGDASQTNATQAIGVGSLQLDGSGDFLQLPNLSQQFTDAATISMWLRVNLATPSQASRTGYDSFGTSTANSHYPWTDGQGYFSTFRNGSRVDRVNLSAVDRSQWHHFAITTEPGTGNYRIYQDGQQIHSADPGTFFFNANATLGKSFGNFFIDGHIDEVLLYNEALSADLIAGLAEGRRPPDETGLFDSSASVDRSATEAIVFETIDLTEQRHLLQDGANVLAIHALNSAADAEQFLYSAELVALTRVPNGDTGYFSPPTPGTENGAGTRFAPLVINELHTDPSDKTSHTEFLELHNAGDSPLNIGGWQLEDGLEYTFPVDTIVPAGGYLVVAADPQSISSEFQVTALGPWIGQLSNRGEQITIRNELGERIDSVSYQLGFPWPTVGDVNNHSMQLMHYDLDNELGGSWRSAMPSPGARNTAFTSLAPPQTRQVRHSPSRPQANEDVRIEIKATDPQGVADVVLEYQVVTPGNYIRLSDTEYQTNWTSLPMADDGADADELAGDSVYSAFIPGSVNIHRNLIRYRIRATDLNGSGELSPRPDDPSPNFAYYVYEGVPDWTGASQPNVTPAQTFGSDVMNQLPVYHLLAQETDVLASQYEGAFDTVHMQGAFVFGDEVFDHIEFSNRGEFSTYVSGKNKWRFHFNRGHDFYPVDNYGRRHGHGVRTLNLNATASPWVPSNRGLAGLEEAVSFGLHDLAGVPSSQINFIQLRVVDNPVEVDPTDQYSGDLWGLYTTLELPDGRFLDERGLEDGTVCKVESGRCDKKNQGPTHPAGTSDWDSFRQSADQQQSLQWWRDNVDLDTYYSFRAINRATGNVDIREGWNHYFYHDPVADNWVPIPWDLDMMFIAETHWSGTINVKNALLHEELLIEYQSRARELIDLLFSDAADHGGQAVQLVDELANLVNPNDLPVTMVDVDEAMWNYHPRTAARNRQGTFYRNPDTHNARGGTYTRELVSADHEGMEQFLKNFMTDTDTDGWSLGDGDIDGYGYEHLLSDAQDANIPQQPTIEFIGDGNFATNDLNFQASDFSDPNGDQSFRAIQWRVGEISNPSTPEFEADSPWVYEVVPVWQSEPLETAERTVQIPGNATDVGRTYRARVRMQDDTGRWSHWSSPIEFVAGEPLPTPLTSALRITELNYNPAQPSPMEIAAGHTNNELFEFIELINTGDEAIQLQGASFNEGIEFTFPAFTLNPNARIVVVGNEAAYRARYGDNSVIAGTWDPTADGGGFSNNGERVRLLDGSGTEVHDFEYDDQTPWPTRADGLGSSLQVVDTEGDYDDPLNWRASQEYHGTPGQAGRVAADIVINEVLSHSDVPVLDAIELHNVTNDDIDVGGWVVSDSVSDWNKFVIPENTTILSGGYLVLDETDFNPTMGGQLTDFSLNGAHGDEVLLVVTDGNGSIERFVDEVTFGAQANGESWGRWPNGAGILYPQVEPTLGAGNTGPRVGPIVISELMYNPLGAEETNEYVEIHNPTNAVVELAEWRVRGGISFEFAPDDSLLPGETILLVPFNPDTAANAQLVTDFRGLYQVPAEVSLYGGYGGNLSNGGELVRLERPDSPPLDEPGFVPRLLEDQTDYRTTAPWPESADGLGDALTRVAPTAWGHAAASWIAAPPTAGFVEFPETFVVVSVDVNSQQVDPPDIDGPQPTNWDAQRSDIRDISITFSRPPVLSIGDITLSNLGVDAPNEADMEIALAADQLVVDGSVATLTFAAYELPQGVYELSVASISSLAGTPLDGNGDGTPGDSFRMTGSGDNGLYRLTGEFNADGGVTIFDFATMGYWFGENTPTAPGYADMNGDQGVSIFDFPLFAGNFGVSVQFPVARPSVKGGESTTGEGREHAGDGAEGHDVLFRDRDWLEAELFREVPPLRRVGLDMP